MSLRDIRRERKLSQVELAELMGVKQSTVSCWESETYTMTANTIRKLTDVLKCTSDELLGISITGTAQASHRA